MGRIGLIISTDNERHLYWRFNGGFDEGKLFDSYFLVLAKQQRTTKQNKPYLSLTLGDKTGQIEGRVWEIGDPRIAKVFERGEMVKVRGSVSRYDERAQLRFDQLRVALANRSH